LDDIDDYIQTIHAMVGFMNFYLYDKATKQNRTNVKLFQGGRLEPSEKKNNNSDNNKVHFVTPDIGIFISPDNGVVGEVKKSFPKDQTFWMETFRQLMNYDDDLMGWPSESKKVKDHDIVLLLHQTRAMAVLEFFGKKNGSEIKFQRPFVVVQFNRSDERKPFFFFQKLHGNLTEPDVNKELGNGVAVPMDIFVGIYSMVKLCDAPPPLPYLLELIWTHVVLDAVSDKPQFQTLRRNQKLEVTLEIDNIVVALSDGFSFKRLCDGMDRQPKSPKTEWVIEACEKLVEIDEAEWVDPQKTEIKIFFRKYEDIQSHFVEACSKEGARGEQLSLFRS
jgi:hypothetical protein